MEIIDNIVHGYLETTSKYKLAPGAAETASLLSIRTLLPNFLKRTLEKTGRSVDAYRCYGSYGQPNRSFPKIPWSLCTRKDISNSAGRGYYIVLLFNEDMSGFWMSLNQGVSSYRQSFSPNIVAREQARIGALTLSNLIPDFLDFQRGPIDLRASKDLGKDYEAAAILSKYYSKDTVNLEATLDHDFKKLLEIYDHLADRVGKDKLRLLPNDEAAYQTTLNDLSKKKTKNTKTEPKPPVRSPGGSGEGGWRRDPNMAAEAIVNAEYECEFCNTPTFISKASKKNFVEAHHLIPMSAQENYPDISLDRTENIVALCPNCHRKIHLGRLVDSKHMISDLYNKRRSKLIKSGFDISLSELTSLYESN